jgi:hypothetical protein
MQILICTTCVKQYSSKWKELTCHVCWISLVQPNACIMRLILSSALNINICFIHTVQSASSD